MLPQMQRWTQSPLFLLPLSLQSRLWSTILICLQETPMAPTGGTLTVEVVRNHRGNLRTKLPRTARVEGAHGQNLRVILRQMVIAVTLLVTGKQSRISGNPSRNLGSPTKVRRIKKLSRPKMNIGRWTKRARTLWCTKGNKESLGLSPPSSCHARHIVGKGVGLVASANTHIPVLHLYLMMITTTAFIWRAR